MVSVSRVISALASTTSPTAFSTAFITAATTLTADTPAAGCPAPANIGSSLTTFRDAVSNSGGYFATIQTDLGGNADRANFFINIIRAELVGNASLATTALTTGPNGATAAGASALSSLQNVFGISGGYFASLFGGDPGGCAFYDQLLAGMLVGRGDLGLTTLFAAISSPADAESTNLLNEFIGASNLNALIGAFDAEFGAYGPGTPRQDSLNGITNTISGDPTSVNILRYDILNGLRASLPPAFNWASGTISGQFLDRLATVDSPPSPLNTSINNPPTGVCDAADSINSTFQTIADALRNINDPSHVASTIVRDDLGGSDSARRTFLGIISLRLGSTSAAIDYFERASTNDVSAIEHLRNRFSPRWAGGSSIDLVFYGSYGIDCLRFDRVINTVVAGQCPWGLELIRNVYRDRDIYANLTQSSRDYRILRAIMGGPSNTTNFLNYARQAFTGNTAATNNDAETILTNAIPPTSDPASIDFIIMAVSAYTNSGLTGLPTYAGDFISKLDNCLTASGTIVTPPPPPGTPPPDPPPPLPPAGGGTGGTGTPPTTGGGFGTGNGLANGGATQQSGNNLGTPCSGASAPLTGGWGGGHGDPCTWAMNNNPIPYAQSRQGGWRLTNYLNNWWFNDFRPALQNWTAEWHSNIINQTRQFGSMMDTINLNRAGRSIQKQDVLTTKDVMPSEMTCTAGTFAPAAATTGSVSNALKQGIKKDMAKRAGGGDAASSSAGTPILPGGDTNPKPATDQFTRYQDYCRYFFDPDANNGWTTCVNGGAGPDPIMNGDIDIEGFLFKDTIDMGDPNTNVTGESRAAMAVVYNLLHPKIQDRLPDHIVETSVGREWILKQHHIQSARNIAMDVVSSIISRRSSVPNTNISTEIRDIRRKAGVPECTISPPHTTSCISITPSYNEIMLAMTKERFYNPQYFIGMQDDIGAITQEQTAINAYTSMQMQDIYTLREQINALLAARASLKINSEERPNRSDLILKKDP